MTEEKIAYELNYEVTHFERYGLNYDYDLEINPFPGYLTPNGFPTIDFSDVEPFPHPPEVGFYGDLKFLPFLDYPYTDNRWCVMSKKMLAALKSVGQFPHRLIKIKVLPRLSVSQTNETDNLFDNSQENTAGNDFVAVQLTGYADVFDWERSDYSRSRILPDRLSDVQEYVFKIPPDGLPPIFRIAANPVTLFISEQARQALKKAGITGTRYISLRGFRHEEESQWIDIPVNPLKTDTSL